MTKFFIKFKKSCFWPIFGPFSQFCGQFFFPENPALLSTTSYKFLPPCRNLEKTNFTIEENARTYGRTERRTDRPYSRLTRQSTFSLRTKPNFNMNNNNI